MHERKRIEITASSLELPKLLKALDQAQVPDYTVFHHITGKSSQGNVSADLEMIGLDNVYILAFCELSLIESVKEKIAPILNKYGGTCFLSDAVELCITYNPTSGKFPAKVR